MNILPEMPSVTGKFVPNLSSDIPGRHLVLLPLTKLAVLQFCTKMLVNVMRQKIIRTNQICTDNFLGNLLVLLQLNWPAEQTLAELVFSLIKRRGHFTYLHFPTFIVCADMIEEFMAMYYPHGGSVNLEFVPPALQNQGTRRIGTRGADRCVKDDFKQIMRQQIMKSHEDLVLLTLQFIAQEHMSLVQDILE